MINKKYKSSSFCESSYQYISMASPRTRRKLNSIRTQDENHVCNLMICFKELTYHIVMYVHFCILTFSIEMFRVRYS